MSTPSASLCVHWLGFARALDLPVGHLVDAICSGRTEALLFMDPGCPLASGHELEILRLLRALRHDAPDHWRRLAEALAPSSAAGPVLAAAADVVKCIQKLCAAQATSAEQAVEGSTDERTLH
jgi:hypothetical protein